MGKRSRFRQMEDLMTKIILVDLVVFVLYLVFASMGWSVFKVITAIITIFGSFLCLGWLFLTGEFPRRRSLWMITALACIAICTVISLLLNFPSASLVG